MSNLAELTRHASRAGFKVEFRGRAFISFWHKAPARPTQGPLLTHNGRRLTQRNETKPLQPAEGDRHRSPYVPSDKLAPVSPRQNLCCFSHAEVGQYEASSRPVAYMPRPKTEWPITLFSRVTFGLGVRDPAMPIPIPGIIIK